MRRIIWTKSIALRDAKRFNSRAEWKRSSYGYEYAARNGFLTEACGHMTGGRGVSQKGYWTLARCKEDGLLYPTLAAWRNSNNRTGYIVAKRNGWLSSCSAHMLKTRRPNGYWKSHSNCLADAQRYTSLSDWEQSSGSAVAAARTNGWLAHCIKHMAPKNARCDPWPIAAILAVAAQYKTISDWRQSSAASYKTAHRKRIVREASAHMISLSSLGELEISRYLQSRGIKYEAQKRFPDCRYRAVLPFDFFIPDFNLLVEFQGSQHKDGYFRNRGSLEGISKRDAIKRQYADTKGFEYIEIWAVKDISPSLDAKLTDIATKSGREIALNAKTMSPEELSAVAASAVWTRESCERSARQYPSKSAWAKGAPGAYSAAHRNGWTALCCAHMAPLWERRWSRDALMAEAKKYSTKHEWANASPNSYAAAHKKRLVDECSRHMTPGRKPNGYWTRERCIEDAKRYKRITDWRRESSSAYVTAKREGWLKSCRREIQKSL